MPREQTSSDLPPGYWVDQETGAWMTLPWPGDPKLPWNDPARLKLLPPTLGGQVIAWAQHYLLHHLTGEPWRFTMGQKRFIYLWYAMDPKTGRWLYRSGVKRGAKGTGKDPFAAALAHVELCGPCQFDGLDAAGQPVGRERGLAKVQIAANSERQAKEILTVASAMASQDLIDDYDMDPGIQQITAYTGRIELMTASEKSNEGGPATAIFLNESHHMTETSGGHKVAAVARRNVTKSPKYIQARLLEFTNAHLKGEDSVAEQSYDAWQVQQSKKDARKTILYDSIEAPPAIDLTDMDSRMRGLRAAYMDAPWADLEGTSDEIDDMRTPVADTIRYYLNGLAAAEDAWVDPDRFRKMSKASEVVAQGEKIAMFLDCSKSSDATGLVGCRISDGHIFTLGVWKRPANLDAKLPWLAPRDEVDGAVMNAKEKYRVVWFGVDPSPAKDDETEALYWAEYIEKWHIEFRHTVRVWATPGAAHGNAVLFDMRMSARGGALRNKAFTEMAMRTESDIDSDEEGTPFTHDGNPMLIVHTTNAKRRPNQWGHTLAKENRDSKHHVDLAVCMVGARLGRSLVIASGKVHTGPGRRRRKGGGVVLR